MDGYSESRIELISNRHPREGGGHGYSISSLILPSYPNAFIGYPMDTRLRGYDDCSDNLIPEPLYGSSLMDPNKNLWG